MSCILLREALTDHERRALAAEFPQWRVLQASQGEISQEEWAQTEILYSSHLAWEELHLAPRLQWVHSPRAHLQGISTKQLSQHERLLVSTTKGQNVRQMGEYAFGAILGFCKNFLDTVPSDQPRPPWTLSQRIFLQVGLDAAGTELTRRARAEGMRVWGLVKERSFHPHCQKTFPAAQLHAVLPAADVVCLCLPRGGPYRHWFRSEELKLLKDDAILIVMGSGGVVDEAVLAQLVDHGRLRGVLIDAFAAGQRPESSPLWGKPGVILSQDCSTQPESSEPVGFQTFHFNLRQYAHHQPHCMKNIIDLEALDFPLR